MSFREIPLSEYPRRAHFEYFTSLSNPYVGVTAEVDVTELKELCKHRGRSFYLAFIDAAARAADCVPALRQRIHSGAIREYDACPTSHTEPLGDGTYCYCTLRHDMPMDEYMEYAVFARKNAVERGTIEEDEDSESAYFVSCIPWVSYTSLVQPTGGESNPHITWGKYFERGGRLIMPVSILAHHALVDGIHIGKFYEKLNEMIEEETRCLKK